ncbi:MAG: fumarylacetoacetate hydrolase family protein [Nitriliruptorales bacterium]
MRWATYRTAGSAEDRVGLVIDDRVHGLGRGESLLGLLGDDGERLAEAGDRAGRDPHEVLGLDEVRLRAPIPTPPSVRDFYAFEDHVATSRRARGYQMDPAWYELPVFYFSNPHGIVGPDDEVALPPGSQALDYELEVAAVLGLGGRDIAAEDAAGHIAGFTIMNDWSARDLQRAEMALHLGPAKGKDFATTLGPFLVTPDELADVATERAYDLTMTASVNGKEYSRANLASIHWSFAELFAYASRGANVAAGDVLGSGTAGTGCILELSLVHGPDAYPWLEPGDEVVLSVDRLGELRNVVTGANREIVKGSGGISPE